MSEKWKYRLHFRRKKKKSYPNPDQRKPKALGLRQRRDAFLGFVVITVLIIWSHIILLLIYYSLTIT